MESSNSEMDRSTSAPLTHEQETSTKLKTFSSEKTPPPTSSSSSLEDLTPVVRSTPPSSSSSHDHDDQNSIVIVASSPSSSHDSDDDDDRMVQALSPIEAPRAQEMERTPSGYRIPPSVFEKNPSSSPMEWSTASNESLFSIHTGNMSFTNDQYYYMWRSGELTPPAEPSTSDHMFSYSSAGGVTPRNAKSPEIGLAEATMLEVIKESENENFPPKSLAEVRQAHRSHGSNTSNTSFAFSMVGGDPGSSTRLHHSMKSNHEQAHGQPEVQVQHPAPAPPNAEPNPKTTPETGNQQQSGWFSCFSCCGGK